MIACELSLVPSVKLVEHRVPHSAACLQPSLPPSRRRTAGPLYLLPGAAVLLRLSEHAVVLNVAILAGGFAVRRPVTGVPVERLARGAFRHVQIEAWKNFTTGAGVVHGELGYAPPGGETLRRPLRAVSAQASCRKDPPVRASHWPGTSLPNEDRLCVRPTHQRPTGNVENVVHFLCYFVQVSVFFFAVFFYSLF